MPPYPAFRLVTTWILASMLCACWRTPYPVVDSGYSVQGWGEVGAAPGIYWIDNDRVIFAGVAADGMSEISEEPKPDTSAIHVWDTKTGRVTELAGHGGGLCYHDGYLRYHYRLSRGEQEIVMVGEGTLQGTTEKVAEQRTIEERLYLIRNEHTCRDFDQRQLPNYGDNVRRIPLRDGHGYLDAGVISGPDIERPLRLFPPGNKEGIELPIKRWQLGSISFPYIEFMNAYLIYAPQPYPGSGITTWPKGRPYPIHFLSPNGAVRTVEIPYIERMVATSYSWPTRKGIVVSVGAHPRHMAVYFVPNASNEARRIVEGISSPGVVSPDGCKLAFRHIVYHPVGVNLRAIPKTTPTLKMIDFCK